MASEGTTEATIAMLERGIEEAEAKARALRAAINTICAESGLPLRYSEDQLIAAPSGSRVMKIQDDTFYGKKQTTAMREYLEMRKAQGIGPAKPRDIFEALRDGGFQFEARDEITTLIALRALLRTQPNVFHKLPQGAYGLTAWYPDAKRSKDGDGDAKSKKRSKKKRKAAHPAKEGRTEKATSAEPASKAEPTLKVVETADKGSAKNQKAA